MNKNDYKYTFKDLLVNLNRDKDIYLEGEFNIIDILRDIKDNIKQKYNDNLLIRLAMEALKLGFGYDDTFTKVNTDTHKFGYDHFFTILFSKNKYVVLIEYLFGEYYERSVVIFNKKTNKIKVREIELKKIFKCSRLLKLL